MPCLEERREALSASDLEAYSRLTDRFEADWIGRPEDPPDPADYLRRVADRFLAVTVWYEPFDRNIEDKRPWALWVSRLTYPLPFLALLVLVFGGVRERLHGAQWAVIAVYVLYLLPYVGISYYERYALPLLGVKVLLVLWAVERVLALRSAAVPGAVR